MARMAIAISILLMVTLLAEGFQEESFLREVVSNAGQRQNRNVLDFLVKSSGNVLRREQLQMDQEELFKEVNDSHNAINDSVVKSEDPQVQNGETPCVLDRPPQEYPRTVWPVPTDYEQIAGLGYYKVHRDKVKWETARRRCAREGGHLLIINSPLEAAAVVATSGLSKWNWVGFDDFTAEGEFITQHGTTLDEAGYTRWAGGEPAQGLRCGVANEVGHLGTGNCDLEREYICEIHRPNEYILEKRSPLLPVGYKAVGNLGFYRVHWDRANWEAARRRCEAEGAHLFVPNSDVEAAAVLRTSDLPSWIWVGFDDFNHHRQYVNFDGQQLLTPGVYSKFAPREPDDKLHCGVARNNAELGTGTCTIKREFICERYKAGEKPKKPSPSPIPPSGYVALGNTSYYKVHRDVVQWETARRRCESEGAHLVVINSQAEADAVLKTSGLPDWFWVGFDDFDAEGEYITVQGTRLVDAGYVNWARNEPTKYLNCGVAKADGKLGTGTCKLQREYICEWERPGVETQPPPSPYPAGYHQFGNLGFYKVHRDRVPWETARRRCRAEGAHLVVVNSEAEANAVLTASGLPEWFWVGFDDFDTKGEYITLQETTLQEAGYEKWARGEPDKNLNCGVANVDGLLGTGNCKNEREYICELNS